MNFVRVLIRWRSFPFLGEIVLGGETQRGCLNSSAGYSSKAQCTGKLSYLEPISQSIQKSIEGSTVFAFSAVNGMLKRQYASIWSVLEIECRSL